MKKNIAKIATAVTLMGGGSFEATRDQYAAIKTDGGGKLVSVEYADRIDSAFSIFSDEDVAYEPLIEYTTQDEVCLNCQTIACGPKLPPPLPPPPTGAQTVDWSIAYVHAVEAQKINDGSSVIVGIVDTGIDPDHPDVKAVSCQDFTGSPNGCRDMQGHGTHVAGSVAAINNGFGLVGASQAKIKMAKGLGDNGSGDQVGIANAIRYLLRNGAIVISMSLGATQGSQAIYLAVQEALQAGVQVVAAAGNAGTSQPNYPAAFPGVKAVSAMDRNFQKANFSSYGNHIWATCPGVQVKSTCKGGSYCEMSGTSMATPVCAGVLALSIAAKKPLKFKPMDNAQFFGNGLPLALESLQ